MRPMGGGGGPDIGLTMLVVLLLTGGVNPGGLGGADRRGRGTNP